MSSQIGILRIAAASWGLILLSSTLAESSCRTPPTRDTIYIRKYEFTDSDEYNGAFQQFRQTFQREAWRIPGKLAPEDLKAGNLKRPIFEPSLDQSPSAFEFKTFDEITRWFTEFGKDALLLMHGNVSKSSEIDIDSTFYLGELGRDVPDSMVREVDQSTVQKLLDNHNLVIAYALTVDAELRGCDRGSVYRMFTAAKEFATQLTDSKQMDGDSMVIAREIDRRMLQLRSAK